MAAVTIKDRLLDWWYGGPWRPNPNSNGYYDRRSQ